MKPKEYAPGEITLSQIYSHPKWRETVMALAKKYPPDYTNQEVDQPVQIAAREAIKRMIQQGNIQEGLSRELSKWMKSTPGKRISEAGETANPTAMQYQKGPYLASKTPFNFSDYEYGPDNTTIVPKKKKAAPPDDSVDNRMGQAMPAPTKRAPSDTSDPLAKNNSQYAVPNMPSSPVDTTNPLGSNNSQYAVPPSVPTPAPQRPTPAPQKSRPGLAPGADPQVYDWQQELRKKNPALVADGLWGPGTDAEAKRQPDIKPPETAKPMPAQPAPRQQPAKPKATAPEEPAQQTGPVTTTISSDEAERRRREGGVMAPKSGADQYFDQHYNPDGTEKVQPAPVRPKPTPAPAQPKPVPQPAQPAPVRPSPAPQQAQPAPPVKAQPSPEMGQAQPAPPVKAQPSPEMGYAEPAPRKKAPPESKIDYSYRPGETKEQLVRRLNPQNYPPQTESKNNSKPKSMKRAANDATGPKFGGYYKGTQKGAPHAGQGFGSMEEGAMGNMTVRSDPLTNLKKPEDLTMKAADPFKGNPNRNNLVSAQARNLVAKGAQTAGPGTGAHQNKALDVKKGDFRKLKHKGSFDFSESTNFLAWAMASGYNVIGNPAVYESAKYEYNMLLAEVKKKLKKV
jgi:hypothetical protein